LAEESFLKIKKARGFIYKTMVMQNHQAGEKMKFKKIVAENFTYYIPLSKQGI